jgi:crossover junction endodeoxyribonuclease RuvC
VFELACALDDLLVEFQPDGMAIESAYHGKNASSALKLAEARGAFKLLAGQRGVPLAEYAPARVKRAVVGRGAGTKAEMQARVRLLCGLEQLPLSDAADALAIAICHVQSATMSRTAKRGGKAGLSA